MRYNFYINDFFFSNFSFLLNKREPAWIYNMTRFVIFGFDALMV
jgi:hypothetical protein